MANYKWLPHLENSTPLSVHGYTISLYSIALEGWRRGLNLKFIHSNRSKSNTVFELSDGDRTHRFISSRGDLITREALRISKNKALAKKYLVKANVPTPGGESFNEDTPDEEIIKYANKRGYPLVIKPIDGTGGQGVIAGINTSSEFIEALKYVRHKLKFKSIIVEDYFKGEDYRVYVINNKAVAVTKRNPANVLGDGKSTVQQLIKYKNKQRGTMYRSSMITIDDELMGQLQKQGYNLESIIPKDKRVTLKTKNNISSGGDAVDITDTASNTIKELAIKACKAIPGLPHAGIDIMFNKAENKGVVIEINTQATIRNHLFPMEGTARDIPTKLINYYFPNTDSNHECPLYFDFGPIWNTLKSGKLKEYHVPNVPAGKLMLTRFNIRGPVRRLGYGKWIKEQADKRDIHGYVKHLENNELSVVVCGQEDNIENFRKMLLTEVPQHVNLNNVRIEQKLRRNPVPIGFKIINEELDQFVEDGYYPVHLADPRRKTSKTKSAKAGNKNNKRIKSNKTVIDYEKEYYKLINSTSWKITKPIRLIGGIIKRIKS